MNSNKFNIGDYVNYNGNRKLVVDSWSDGDMRLSGISGYVKQYKFEKWVEPTEVKVEKVSNNFNIFKRGILKAKLKFPKGATLNEEEAQYIIDGWSEEKSLVKTKQSSLMATSDKIEKHLAKTEDQIATSLKSLKTARTNFLKTKNPVVKQKWATKVVVRAAYYEQVRNSHLALTSTVERVKDAVDDAQYVYKTLESRIAEAKIYRELNGGLTLVGKTLQEARTKHLLPEVEYTQLEVTMESLEGSIKQKPDTQILSDANAIVNDSTRWFIDDSKTNSNKTEDKKRTTKRKSTESKTTS